MTAQSKKCLRIGLAACLVLALCACGDTQAATAADSGVSNNSLLERSDNTENEAPDLESQEGPPPAGDTSSIKETAEAEAPAPEETLDIQIGDRVLTAELADNSSAEALAELLADGPLTLELEDYGDMEKVGPIGTDLPRNDEQITTEAGDIILYQGNSFVIYYAPNSWNFTRLGKINDLSEPELRELLGDGSVTVTLSIGQDTEP